MVRNILLALLFTFSVNISFAQSKIEKKYDNGTIEQTGYLDKNNLKDSTWLQYNPAGILTAEAHFKNGVKVGVWKTYFDDGKLMFEIPYINGVKSGKAFQFDQVGQIVSTKNY